MLKKKYVWATLAVPVIMALVYATANPAPVIGRIYATESISAVKLSPAFYMDNPITIAGKVVEGTGHFGISAYKVADKTGDMMVFYNGNIKVKPALGSIIVVRGKIEEISMMGTQKGIFLSEQNRILCWGGDGKVSIKNNTI